MQRQEFAPAHMPPVFRQLSPSPHVLVQVVGGEAVLLDLKTEKYFGLNPVGLRIWQLLQENGDVQSLRLKMLEEYEVDEEQLDKDLDDLLERLVKAGLLSERPD